MAQVTFDSRKSEYTGIGPTSANETSPSRQPASPVYNLAVDKQGNRYTIDGKANVIKYTSSNEAVWSFAVPVLDTAHLCRAIAVDDNGLIFVGVSANGRVEDARIFALQQLPDESVEVLWTQDDALVTDVLKATDTEFDLNVRRCRYAEMYREMGLGHIGHLLSCNRDFVFCRGYDARIALERTQTLMQGASHCDFRYRLKEPAGGEKA